MTSWHVTWRARYPAAPLTWGSWPCNSVWYVVVCARVDIKMVWDFRVLCNAELLQLEVSIAVTHLFTFVVLLTNSRKKFCCAQFSFNVSTCSAKMFIFNLGNCACCELSRYDTECSVLKTGCTLLMIVIFVIYLLTTGVRLVGHRGGRVYHHRWHFIESLSLINRENCSESGWPMKLWEGWIFTRPILFSVL